MIKGIVPALSEAGKIKIGGLGEMRKSRNGAEFRMPVKLDHFVVTKTSRNGSGDLEVDEVLMSALPKDADGKCRSIPVVLHSDSIDEVFPTTYAMYSGKKLACRGDGETAVRWAFDQQTRQRLNQTKSIACPCEYLEKRQCKPHGTLHCSILLQGQAVAGAVYKWRTTGLISIQRMIGSMQQILSVVGTLRGLPLVLRVQPVTVSPDGKTTTVYSCHLELRAKDLVEVQGRALEAARIRGELGGATVPYRALIQAPAADTESPDEQEEVWSEFHAPEEIDADEPESTTTDSVKNLAVAQAGGQKAAIVNQEVPKQKPVEASKPKAEKPKQPQKPVEAKQQPQQRTIDTQSAPVSDVPDYGAPDQGGDVQF